MPNISRRRFLILLAAASAAAIGGIGAFEGLSRLTRSSSSSSTQTTTATTTISTATESSQTVNVSKYLPNIQSALAYLTAGFNSTLNLIAQGTGSNLAAVQFYFFNGQSAPSLASSMTFEPMECWKQGWCAIDFPPQQDPQLGYKVLAGVDALKTSVNWVHNMKDTPLLGIPVGYDFPNDNMSFTPNLQQPQYPTVNGSQYAIDQASRFDLQTLQWIPWNSAPYTNAVGWNPSAIDFVLFSALNFAMRQRMDLAQQNVSAVAQNMSLNSDGSVIIGTAPSRGIFLGIYLYACSVLNYFPALPDNIQYADIESTIWRLQQSDGSVARNYTNFSSTANGDNETTSAAVLAYCAKLISYVQGIINSKLYDLNSAPPSDFAVNPFGQTV